MLSSVGNNVVKSLPLRPNLHFKQFLPDRRQQFGLLLMQNRIFHHIQRFPPVLGMFLQFLLPLFESFINIISHITPVASRHEICIPNFEFVFFWCPHVYLPFRPVLFFHNHAFLVFFPGEEPVLFWVTQLFYRWV